MTTAPYARVPTAVVDGQQSVSLSTSSAASANAIGDTKALVYSTVECFLVHGTAPTATVAAGLPIPANQLIPVTGFLESEKLAAITASGTGTLYIIPGA